MIWSSGVQCKSMKERGEPPKWALQERRAARRYWCTSPSPGSSFSAREKAFPSAFFCRSGTAITPCLRSLCTYNFLKSVHFLPRLDVYHPFFDCFEHMFTVYLPFFACSRRWNAETALGRREAAKKKRRTHSSLTQAERRPGTGPGRWLPRVPARGTAAARAASTRMHG